MKFSVINNLWQTVDLKLPQLLT